MNLNRRDFLKGMLAISVAATVLPILPAVPEAAAESPLLDMAPVLDFTPKRAVGRLGQVRIDRKWFSLEDAEFSMFRRHVPKFYHSRISGITEPIQPHTEREIMSSFSPAPETSLVNSPWQVKIWSPDWGVQNFFDERGELEFEFSTRQVSFVGNGFVTEMNVEIMRAEEENSALFSIVLEGDKKLRRYGEVKEEFLI